MTESNTLVSNGLNNESNPNIVNKIYFNIYFFYFSCIKDPAKFPIISWTTNDVEQWLKSLNLSNFIDKFCKENGIDGLTLLLMKEDDLKQSPLSIQRLCDIKRLWYHIRLLQCKQNDFYSLLNDETTNYDRSSLSPTHLLNTNNLYSINPQEKPVSKILKGEKGKTLVSFIYAMISGIWTSFIMVVVHNRVPNVQK
jgi:hypothetical protein